MKNLNYVSPKKVVKLEREIKKRVSSKYCSGKINNLIEYERACYLCLITSCRLVGAVNTKMLDLRRAVGLGSLDPHELVGKALHAERRFDNIREELEELYRIGTS